jgi:hypothetical protein
MQQRNAHAAWDRIEITNQIWLNEPGPTDEGALPLSQRCTRENDPARRNTVCKVGFVEWRDDADRCHRRRNFKCQRQHAIRCTLDCTIVRQPLPDRVSNRIVAELRKPDTGSHANNQIAAWRQGKHTLIAARISAAPTAALPSATSSGHRSRHWPVCQSRSHAPHARARSTAYT